MKELVRIMDGRTREEELVVAWGIFHDSQVPHTKAKARSLYLESLMNVSLDIIGVDFSKSTRKSALLA